MYSRASAKRETRYHTRNRDEDDSNEPKQFRTRSRYGIRAISEQLLRPEKETDHSEIS